MRELLKENYLCKFAVLHCATICFVSFTRAMATNHIICVFVYPLFSL